VITRRLQQLVIRAVHQRVQRTFRAAQEFLDHDPPACLAEAVLVHHLVDCRSCSLRIGRDDHALAQRKPVGFNDNRKPQPVAKPERIVASFERACLGRRNPLPAHQFLCKNLGGLQLRGCFGRPKNTQA
jgi:hypothetical protein